MVICAVVSCGSRSNRDHRDGIRFFAVPKAITNQCQLSRDRTVRRRALWISRINKADLQEGNVKDYTKVCSRHFILGAPAAVHDENNPDWAPSLNMGHNISQAPNAARYQRQIEKSAKRVRFTSSVLELRSDYMEIVADIATSDHGEVSAESAEPSRGDFVPKGDMDSITEDVQCYEDVVASVEDYSTCEGMESVPSVDTSVDNHKITKLQKDYNELMEEYANLRNQLTEVVCDKMEVEKSLTGKESDCHSHKDQIQELERVNVDLLDRVSNSQSTNADLTDRLQKHETKLAEMQIQLEIAIKGSLHLDDLKSNPNKIKFYTGLPSYEVFDLVLSFVTDHITESPSVGLAPWQSLLLTLMRLRLNLTLQDLAYRFGVSVSKACRTFERWLYTLYKCLEQLIIWPDTETQYKTLPNSFKDAFNESVAVIIDCFEVFIERPGALDTRAMTWSIYKHHNTVKYLIGITPCGSISFIWKAYGGRASDKHITLECGLLDKLLPNDVVMADRVFLIGEELGFQCARLAMPAFTRGQPQLSSHDMTDTRKIATLRIHVERIFGLTRRRYSILHSTLQTDFLVKKPGHELCQVDEIVHVCCALTNLGLSIM